MKTQPTNSTIAQSANIWRAIRYAGVGLSMMQRAALIAPFFTLLITLFLFGQVAILFAIAHLVILLVLSWEDKNFFGNKASLLFDAIVSTIQPPQILFKTQFLAVPITPPRTTLA